MTGGHLSPPGNPDAPGAGVGKTLLFVLIFVYLEHLAHDRRPFDFLEPVAEVGKPVLGISTIILVAVAGDE